MDDRVHSFCIAAGAVAKTNPTFLPDDIFTSFIPVFTIRHPALVVESWYRAESRALNLDLSVQTWESNTGYSFLREVYDWFLQNCPDKIQKDANEGQGPFHPLIIDADDVLEDEQTIPRLCRLIHMDPSLVPSDWEAQELPTDAWTRSFLQGFLSSTCIDKSKSANGLDLEERYQIWREEFGDGIAQYLIKFTERDLAHYRYLKERAL